ncbi:MAG: hypothetical protein O2793_12245 [Proteobacteria bacterium]|nr:hypothetical protein [Pseudomonadota bacterium]MDA1254858.1 hypothetical protein [Pseudomonadota bacterium]
MSELKTYTEEELAEHQQLYDEVFTPVWESEGQYCRAGGGQYEKSFAWWAFKNQQSKVDELQRRNQMLNDNIKEQGQKLVCQNEVIETQAEKLLCLRDEKAELQKRINDSQDIIESILARSLDNPEIQDLCGQLIDVLEQALKGGEA